ncbi:MAG: DUF1573 domain-containing protein [Bacteroidota bacterium]
MKKIFAIVLSLFALQAFSQQQVPPTNNNEPKAEINFEATSFDFGNIKEGTLAAHEFIFTNTGKVPLVLSNVQPSCGCTSPEWSREPIAPGAKGKIKAVYNSYGRPGTFQKYIYVKSNAASGEVDLTIKGTVLATPPEPVSPVRNPLNND